MKAGEVRVEEKVRLVDHIRKFIIHHTRSPTRRRAFRPQPDGVNINKISEEKKSWHERPFLEQEVFAALNCLREDKALGPYRFPLKLYKEFLACYWE